MKTKINLEKMEGWNFYGDASLLEYAPKAEGKLEFFTLGRHVSDSELAKEYGSRGLTPANPELIAEYILANPDFAEKYIATHWYDEAGKWCYAAFRRWSDERGVDVRRRVIDWGGIWYFVGVRKGALTSDLSTEQHLDTLNFEALTKRVHALEEIIKHHNLGV